MREIHVEVPQDWPTASVLGKVGAVLEASELILASSSTLKSLLGSTHWHLQNGADKGTLELTWWPHNRRLWFSVHANREGPWIDDAIGLLSADLQALP